MDAINRDEAVRLTHAQRAVLERIVSELSNDPETQRNVVDALAQVAGIETLLSSNDLSQINLPDLMRFLHAQTDAALAHATAEHSQSAIRAQEAEAAELAAARNESRQQVQSLMRDFRRFDPFLTFASPEDEAAYHTREAQRLAYIERQHARGTPEGDLNASGAAIGQMIDASAHGADRSPEFRQRWDELVATSSRLREQVARNGGSTREFDLTLLEELRISLRTRGISDAEIEARFAAHPNDPLAAVQEFMRNESDLRSLDRAVGQIGRRESIAPPPPPIIVAVAEQSAARPVTMQDAMAEFRAAGITTADHRPGEAFAHGVTAQERSAPSTGRG